MYFLHTVKLQAPKAPVITITYDGTSEYKNDIIKPYLQSCEEAINEEIHLNT